MIVRLWWHTTIDMARSNIQALKWTLDSIDWALQRLRT